MTASFIPGAARRAFAIDVERRLLSGQHLVVQGPRGIGKTTLAGALARRLGAVGVPCGYSSSTASLRAVTTAIQDAYGLGANTSQRSLRNHLRLAAERKKGVLLLDHVAAMSTAMKGFLRSLRGGLVGVAYFIDVDTQREHVRLRSWHVGHVELALPPLAGRTLSALLVRGDRRLERHALTSLVRAAHGRPGFVTECLALLKRDSYWHDSRLHVSTLAADAEIAVRSSGTEALSTILRQHETKLAQGKIRAESWKGTHHHG